jgi:hypothetical protein
MIGAIVWVEHGEPEAKRRRHAGFGSRLVKAVLDGYGGVRLDLNNTGLACFMAVDLDRPHADRGANQYITQVWQQTALTFDETLNVARSTADVIHAMSRDWPTDR